MITSVIICANTLNQELKYKYCSEKEKKPHSYLIAKKKTGHTNGIFNAPLSLVETGNTKGNKKISQ